MKWKLIYVVISLLSLSVVGCWPFAPPAPPPPPALLYEDHYLRFQGPYDRGINQMGSHPSGEAIHPMGTHHVNHHLFFPVSPLNPPMTFPEPEERAFPNSHDFDLGNTQEFVDFPPPEPHLMKIRHMNYRYRKRLRTHKPVEEEGFGHHKEVHKYSQSFNSQPKRYNVIDSRGEYQKRIPNSVNEKLQPKKYLIEEESHRQNTSTNKLEKFDRKTEIRAKDFRDLEGKGSQNKDTSNSIRPTVDMPIEVTSYAMKSPDGGVTQVTEMLYDVENSPFKVPTSTPIVTPVWRPSTPLFHTVTEEPSVTQTPYLNSAYSETETGSTIKIPPINTAVTAKFNDITMSPVLSFTSPHNTMDPFLFEQSSTFPVEPTLPPTPPRLRPTVQPSDYYSRRNRKRFSTQKAHTTPPQRESSARESKAGLSGAAIAGIVIGSMVSIMLLAGTSLFVMYRNPFRRTLSPQRSSDTLPNVRPTEASTVPRVHRWQTRRQRRL